MLLTQTAAGSEVEATVQDTVDTSYKNPSEQVEDQIQKAIGE